MELLGGLGKENIKSKVMKNFYLTQVYSLNVDRWKQPFMWEIELKPLVSPTFNIHLTVNTGELEILWLGKIEWKDLGSFHTALYGFVKKISSSLCAPSGERFSKNVINKPNALACVSARKKPQHGELTSWNLHSLLCLEF